MTWEDWGSDEPQVTNLVILKQLVKWSMILAGTVFGVMVFVVGLYYAAYLLGMASVILA